MGKKIRKLINPISSDRISETADNFLANIKKSTMKVQVVAGANAIEEIKTIKVRPDTDAKSDLISIKLAN